MAEAKVIPLPGGAAEKSRARRGEPLAEAHIRDNDRYPIWVSIRNPEHVRGVFMSLFQELNKAGFRCDSDLQTEPHEGLAIEANFEVFLQVDQKRAPENLGMVTLYSDSGGNLAIKMSPYFPEACDDFRTALSTALKRQLGDAGGGRAVSMDIAIRQQAEYEPLAAPAAENAPKPA